MIIIKLYLKFIYLYIYTHIYTPIYIATYKYIYTYKYQPYLYRASDIQNIKLELVLFGKHNNCGCCKHH